MIPAKNLSQLRVVLPVTPGRKTTLATDIYTDTIIDILQQLQDIEIDLVESLTSLGSIGVFATDVFEDDMDFNEDRYQLTGDKNIENLMNLLQVVRSTKRTMEAANGITI